MKLFFSDAVAYPNLPEPLFPLADLAAVKQSGGLNNDWDLSCRVISLLFNVLEKPPVYESKDPWDRYRETIRQCDLTPLIEFLRSSPKPLRTLLAKAGAAKNSFIYGLYTGDVGSGNIVKHIFQEVYLGPQLFEATYGRVPKFYKGEGFNQREQLLIDKQLLEELAADHILAIATGRPRTEADYPLERFDLRKYFSEILALEDCLGEEHRIWKAHGKKVSLSKPHPYMLDAIAQKCENPPAAYFYIGDMPDDMVAAKKSQHPYKGIGFLLSAPDQEGLKKELLDAGADYIIDSLDQLRSLIKSD